MKSSLGEPHRNLIDFAHVRVVKGLARLPVCTDPSHAAGRRTLADDGLTDIHHATAQGVIAGATPASSATHPSAACDADLAPALVLVLVLALVADGTSTPAHRE